MAISWGPWQSRGRVGVEASYSPAVGSTTTSVNVRMDVYLQLENPASSAMNSTWSYSGDFGGGSVTQFMDIPPGGTVLVNTWVKPVVLTDSAQSLRLNVSVPHWHGTSSISDARANVPARYARTPSSLSVTRISDTSHRLNWTRNSTYSAVIVQRRDNGGAWKQVGRPGGNAATWTDTSTRANSKFEYRVAGVGGSGQSGWSNIATVYTTPAPVGSVTAVKVGTSIEVSAGGLPPYAETYSVYEGAVLLQSGIAVWPWTHAAPSASLPHTYTVYAHRGALRSDGTVSNTVQLLAPPLAPTALAPNGGVAASDVPVRFSWKHSPVDTTDQVAYELRSRPVGGAWQTLTGTTAQAREVELAAGSYEWQVRTRGQHATYGPWAAIATAAVITRPGVAVQGGGTWDRPLYLSEWEWTQDEGRPQSAWQAELLDGEGVRLEFREGSGATSTVAFKARLEDAGAYTVRVRAATGDVWSDWSPLEFTVEFVPPAEPVATGGWDESTGAVEIAVVDGEGDIRPDLLTLERSVDGGETWELFVDGVPFDAVESYTDTLALSSGETWYRATGTVAETGAAASVVVVIAADSPAVWLSGGEGFVVSSRLPYSPSVAVTAGRARVARRYAGRELPVTHVGEALTRVVDSGGVLLLDEQSPDVLAALVQDTSPVHLYRDPDGRRIFGMLSDVQLDRESHAHWGFGFQLTETEAE